MILYVNYARNHVQWNKNHSLWIAKQKSSLSVWNCSTVHIYTGAWATHVFSISEQFTVNSAPYELSGSPIMCIWRGFSCFYWIGHYNTHKTNYCRNYLRWKESAGTLKTMDWTPQSPDLNPIEQTWGELENKLDRSVVHSKESLWLELQKAWDNISVDVLRKYIDTIPERFAVIAAKGGHTKC